jgi:hypothetical protein
MNSLVAVAAASVRVLWMPHQCILCALQELSDDSVRPVESF